ncbi:hypothetical protein D3C86_2194060 [compost metagenome]
MLRKNYQDAQHAQFQLYQIGANGLNRERVLRKNLLHDGNMVYRPYAKLAIRFRLK